MDKDKRMGLEEFDDTEIKINKLKRFSFTDILIMIGGVVTIGIVTILLSWMIL